MKNGFFVSCKKGKELKAFKELHSVLNSSFQSIETQKDYCTLNVSDEIKNEIKLVQASFFSIYFTYKSILYVSNSSPLLPSKLFQILKERGVLFEYIHRIVPLDRFITYNEEVILSCISGLDRSLSFKIDYEERFAPKETRTKIFKLITDSLQGMKVDLINPDYIIIIQALKVDIGITVLKNSTESFNFSRNIN